jgi:nucleoside 2-deoxyribosyltransferase
MFEKTFQVIVEVCRKVGLRCYRGDEEKVEGDLLPHILRAIARSRLVIAVLDGRNPNVFYELGIAQALDKPTVLLARQPKSVPFDVNSQKLILCKNRLELKLALETELTRALVKIRK